MKYAILVARLIFGVWFIMSGLRGISPDMPMGHNEIPRELLGALVTSNVIWVVKAIEFVVGVSMLLNLYVPLALIVGYPVTLMVAYVCLYLEFPNTRPLIGGSLTLAVHSFLLLAYFDCYKSFLVMRAKPGGPMHHAG
ncbi:MAG: DoxX family membrane protein [Hyphomonadaceae bacterium]|nr:DoxX family membrane protein [Hyphomonadaceae bacterium]